METVKTDLVLTQDELEVLEAYRRAKNIKFADVVITVDRGERVKLWVTEKRK